MTAKVIGIGNSAGIVIPASLLAALNLKKDDRVIISETPVGFEVKKVEKPKSFESLMESYYSKPFAEAVEQFRGEGDDVEIDWGAPQGEEVW